MVGDSADNVPGIPGIGPKTAQELLEEFESFEELWEFRDEVESPRLRKIVEENVEKVRAGFDFLWSDVCVCGLALFSVRVLRVLMLNGPQRIGTDRGGTHQAPPLPTPPP